MDSDLNIYDVEHVCTAHPKMSKKEWEDIYHEAWSLYYTPEHMKTLLRRAAATGVPMGSLVKVLAHLRDNGPSRKSAPAPRRNPAPQASLRASAGFAARKPLGLLAALRVGDPRKHIDSAPARSWRLLIWQIAIIANGPGAHELYGPGPHACQRRRGRDARPSYKNDRWARRSGSRQEDRRTDRRSGLTSEVAAISRDVCFTL